MGSQLDECCEQSFLCLVVVHGNIRKFFVSFYHITGSTTVVDTLVVPVVVSRMTDVPPVSVVETPAARLTVRVWVPKAKVMLLAVVKVVWTPV